MPMSTYYTRLMGFCAGPQNHTFVACEAHRPELERGDVSCFWRLKDEPVRAVDLDDEDARCYFCQEG